MNDVQSNEKSFRPKRTFFIDSENNVKQLLVGFENLNPDDVIVVFHRGCFSKECKAKLESCRAKVEWINCVSPKTKNSMDFQIVSEFSIRLASNSFDHGYIVSCDKGYLAAVNYLANAPQGKSHVISLASSINEAITGNISSYTHFLEEAKTPDDIREYFALFMSSTSARKVVDVLEGFFQRITHEKEGSNNVFSLRGNTRTSSLLELPGIGTALAKRLEEVGIGTEGELRKIGAIDAWGMVHEKDQMFPSKWVYTFEAALQGIRATELDDTLKEKLRHDVEVAIPAQAA